MNNRNEKGHLVYVPKGNFVQGTIDYCFIAFDRK